MERGSCIYCGREREGAALLERGGKYRCKDEEECLDYQVRQNAPDPLDDPEEMARLIHSLGEAAAERLAAWRAAPAPAEEGDPGTAEAWPWLVTALEALAAAWNSKPAFRFQGDGERGYGIAYAPADGDPVFHLHVAPLARSRFALTLAAGEGPYGECLFRVYPEGRRETLLEDLALLLLVLETGAPERAALLGRFRREEAGRA